MWSDVKILSLTQSSIEVVLIIKIMIITPSLQGQEVKERAKSLVLPSTLDFQPPFKLLNEYPKRKAKHAN